MSRINIEKTKKTETKNLIGGQLIFWGESGRELEIESFWKDENTAFEWGNLNYTALMERFFNGKGAKVMKCL